MQRLRRVSRVPLGIFAHVQQHDFGILQKPRVRLLDGDFADARLGVGDDFQETG
jgi:hypothetical protein